MPIDAMRTTIETPGEALARLIVEKGLKKQWVANHLGMDRHRLARLLRDEGSLRVGEAAKLATLFDVPIETFIPAEAA